MKRKNIFIVFLLVFLIFLPTIVLTSFDLFTINTFNEYYYAELGNMYNKLTSTKGKKIVIIGNSNVSFGVESRLFEDLINTDEESYTVVNFGLYGSIGTKAMLDLAKNHINAGDIVIFSPEEYTQSMSLYFSANEMWLAIGNNRKMAFDLDSRSKEALLGNYANYVSRKYQAYINNNNTDGLGIYQTSSFDENCDLLNYDREYNIMFNDYDENNPIDLNNITISDQFIDYINNYNDSITKKGARMYFSFSPMNRKSITNTFEEINEYYNFLRERLEFPIISDINTYIMDSEWFYDSNYHLNTSGMKVRTVNLVWDLKNELGITTKTEFPRIEKPVKPDSSIEGEGDNSNSDCFIYEKNGNYYKIIGLTEIGKTKEELIVPYQVDGYYINEIDKDVFAFDRVVKKIYIQKNIKRIYDNSFYGCESLIGVYLDHDSPSEISVGFNLLVGTAGNIYVGNNVKSSFINDYFFGAYQERIYGYEKD